MSVVVNINLNKKTSNVLESYVERIERINEERGELATDLSAIYASAKSAGFDVKTMRKIVALRKMDASDRADEQAILEGYMLALGMQLDMFDRSPDDQHEVSDNIPPIPDKELAAEATA